MEIVAKRTMNYAYPILDAVFLVVFCLVLLLDKKYRALVWGCFGGVLYFVVDFCIFHLLTGSRSIQNASLFWVLLWMSMSYGLTNFVWIWLWFDRDKNFWGYSAVIFFWWIACPMISQMFVNSPVFSIQRTTNSYHGIMGLILFLSYLGTLVYNMHAKTHKRVNVLWLIAIGVLVQLAWEFALLMSGIRSGGFGGFEMIKTLVINSLVETNLGIPLMYLIYVKSNKLLDSKNLLMGKRILPTEQG